MPKISDERRLERRLQILNAAWRCFQRDGLHATTMGDIVQASGLSAGAVYSYFKSKDDLIVAALTTSLSGLRSQLAPLFDQEPPLGPAALLRAITTAIVELSARDGFDLKRIALLGWSEAQRNETLRAAMQSFYRPFRAQIAAAAERWKATGAIAAEAAPDDMAKSLLAIILGFVVEAAVLGDVSPESIERGVAALGPLGRSDTRGGRHGQP